MYSKIERAPSEIPANLLGQFSFSGLISVCHFGLDSDLDWDTLARTLWTETFWTDTFWTVTFWTRTLWIETLWIKALLKTHFGLTHFGLSYSEIHFNVKINEENIYIHTIMFISVVKKVLHRTMLSIMAKLNTYDFFHSFQLFLMTLIDCWPRMVSYKQAKAYDLYRVLYDTICTL